MPDDYRTLKVSDAIRALELGGYAQARTYLLNTGDGDDKVVEACAIGIMALNLGVDAHALASALDGVVLSNGDIMSHQMVDWNDTDRKSVDTILKALKTKTRKVLDQPLVVKNADYSRLENFLGVRV